MDGYKLSQHVINKIYKTFTKESQKLYIKRLFFIERTERSIDHFGGLKI